MTRLIQNLRKNSTKLLLATAAAAALLVPTMASAADRDFHSERDRHPDVRVGIRIGDSTPSYETRTERVWVEPVYQTQVERIWREPVVRDQCVRVWVEPVSRMREVEHHEGWRRVVSYERVMISPGHWEDQHTQVVVRQGYFENVEHRVLVSSGHWEERPCEVRTEPRSFWSVFFGIHGH